MEGDVMKKMTSLPSWKLHGVYISGDGYINVPPTYTVRQRFHQREICFPSEIREHLNSAKYLNKSLSNFYSAQY